MAMSRRNHGSHLRVLCWMVEYHLYLRDRNSLSRKVNMLDSIKMTGPHENKLTVTLLILENSGGLKESTAHGEEMGKRSVRYQEISRPLSREKCNCGGQEHRSQDMSLSILSTPHEESLTRNSTFDRVFWHIITDPPTSL